MGQARVINRWRTGPELGTIGRSGKGIAEY